MKNVVITSVLAAALFASACSDPTAVDPRPRVRFFNATTGMAGSGAFTTNGQFVTGSAVAFGQSTATCATVDSGATSFAFGAANGSGTGLSGAATATLSNMNLEGGGDYTVVTAGPAASPTLFVFEKSKYPAPLGSQQAGVRFVNLAPATGTGQHRFFVYPGVFGPGISPLFIDPDTVGMPTGYKSVTSGATSFSLVYNLETPAAVSGAPFTLKAGSVNTIAIVPNPSGGGGYQLIKIPNCT